MSQLLYDKTSSTSILDHARKLLGKSIHDLYPKAASLNTGKGGLGQCVEVYHFGYDINGISEADFSEAGVELKCTPLKTIKDGSMVSKERLVLNIINYLEEYGKSFETSSFTRKNTLLLLMFYLHIAGVDNLDLIFKIIRLWRIPEEDLKIFMDDWNVIHDKIVKGLAHELSEGDTLYLAACVKGSKGGANKKPQKIGGVLADQRAYSIKSAYLNHIIVDSLSHPEMFDGVTMTAKQKSAIKKKKSELGRVIKSVKEYKAGETFEQLVERRFKPYIGMTIAEISQKLKTEISSSPKAVSYSVCRAILGVKERRIAEFEKADLLLKTIRLEHNGNLKEAMSFQTIKYKKIVGEEEWEESDWYNTIATRRFLFIIFRKAKDGLPCDAVLEQVFFWSMPRKDIEAAESFWRDTRDKVRSEDYAHFIKSTEHPICHVRPKAKKAADLAETPQGGKAKKLCYWLNRDYILNIVNGHLKK
ncbi:MAG: Sau3AI family type II restriction endonuclease [Kiritimatiellia bacterium]